MYCEIRRSRNCRCSSSVTVDRLVVGWMTFTIGFCSVVGGVLCSGEILEIVLRREITREAGGTIAPSFSFMIVEVV